MKEKQILEVNKILDDIIDISNKTMFPYIDDPEERLEMILEEANKCKDNQ